MKSQGLSCGLITQASSAWGGPPFSAACWREGAQSLIAGPQDKQVNRKRGGGGERVNIELGKNNTKRNGRTHSKGHTGHTGELSSMHMYPHTPYVRSLKCNQWPCQQPAPCGADC